MGGAALDSALLLSTGETKKAREVQLAHTLDHLDCNYSFKPLPCVLCECLLNTAEWLNAVET